MDEPNIPRTKQVSGEFVQNDENQVLKPPPRKKKSLRKNKMEAEISRKIAASHSNKSENEQLETSMEEQVVKEGISPINIDNNKSYTDDLCNVDEGEGDDSRPSQQLSKHSDNESEISKSAAQNKNINEDTEESKTGETPGSITGYKMTTKDSEVSKLLMRNNKDDNIARIEVQDDQMGNKNASLKSKAKNTDSLNSGNREVNHVNNSVIKDSLNGNQAVQSGDVGPAVVVNENFNSFCLVEKLEVQTSMKDEQDSKEIFVKEGEDFSGSHTNSEAQTSGIQSSCSGDLINCDLKLDSNECVNESSCDSHADTADNFSDIQEYDDGSTTADNEEQVSQLHTNNINTSDNLDPKPHTIITPDSSNTQLEESQSNAILAFQNPLSTSDTSDFNFFSQPEKESMQKECIAESDWKQDVSMPGESGSDKELFSIPYRNLDQEDVYEESDNEESSTDTDSDTYYSDYTSSEGEYSMADAEKLCDVVDGFKKEDDLPGPRDAEPDSINQILSAFQETETVTVTADSDNSSHRDDISHGNNAGLELSEERAQSLKRKIGSFKVVQSREPEVDKVDVKKASVGIATKVVATETDSAVDSTKSAELAILALHKEHKIKHAERREKQSRETNEKLEISRPRSLVGEPRTRSRSTGDLDNIEKPTHNIVTKQNSLSVRAKSLKLAQEMEVDFDERTEVPLFGDDNTYLTGVATGSLVASMGHLEESREKRESGSPLFTQSSSKRESEAQMVAEVGSRDDSERDSTENDSEISSAPTREDDIHESGTHSELNKPSRDSQEQTLSFEDHLTAMIQVDNPSEELSPSLGRLLSSVREESSSSLESGASFSQSSRGSSASQEHKTQAEEASTVSKASTSPANEDELMSVLEKWEWKNGIQDEESRIDNDETSSKGIDILTPSSTHEDSISPQDQVLSQSGPTTMISGPKTPFSNNGIKKSGGSVNNVQLRQMKITKAKRKGLSQSLVITSELPQSPTEVKLMSVKKKDELDTQDSGVSDQEMVSNSSSEVSTNVKQGNQVALVKSPSPGEVQEVINSEKDVTPKRPPRKEKVNRSESFSPSPRTPRADTNRKIITKRVKTGRREGGSRWQTLSGAITDSDWLSRLGTKPPIEPMSEEQITLVTDAIPACFPTFPTDKRAQIALELYTTERTYVRGLEIVIELFKNPLQDYLEPKEKAAIFSNIDEIFKVNKDVLFSLCERISHWKVNQMIGDIFVDNADRFKIYATYCNNFDTAENLIKQKIKKRKEFDEFLENCYENTVCQPGLKLPAYLITVVQRIPRYLLLLRDLVKCTPSHHPDTRPIKEGLHKMNNIAEYINNQLQAVQGQRAMTELRSRVIGIKAFETPGRSLIKEGEVYIMSTKRTCKCLLFNDMVVFAAKNVNKRIEVELTLELESIWVADLEDNDPQTSKEDAIELYTPERSYIMYTGTKNEKKHWLQKLRTAIAIRLHGEMATDSSEIRHRKSDFTYRDGRIYCGKFVDGKRQGYGVIAWQNRTRYVGNFEDDERKGIGELTYSTGEKYNGEWLDDKQHGVGTLTFPNKDVYTGEWKRGKMNGKGLIKFNNDDILDGDFVDNEVCGSALLNCANGLTYNGKWKNSKKHGKGKLVKPNGDTYEGDFLNDRMNGEGTMVYANKKGTYIGHWENNQRHGKGVYTAPDDTVYDGEWRGDHMSGRGKMMYANGELYDGSWYRDMRFGKGILRCQEGIYDGKFEYNVRHGIGTMQYKDSSEYEGEWQHDQCHGQGKMIYADSSVYDGNWMLGLRNGHGKMTYPNGATYEGNWDLGSEHGSDGVFIDNANNYSYEGGYEYGCKQGQGVEKTSNGMYEGDFKANMRHGKGKETLKCGTVYEGHWRDNRKVGKIERRTRWGETETTEVQYWKEGKLLNQDETIAPDLPFIQRITDS